MNCVSIAFDPPEPKATIKRVIEYFCPNDREGSRIWVDIFLDNLSEGELTLKLLHAGSLSGKDVTEASWGGPCTTSDCECVLTRRIEELHEDYLPIATKYYEKSVQLGKDVYHAWKGNLRKVIGDDQSAHVPFTLWQLDRVVPGKTVVRLCLEMHGPTRQERLGNKGSFYAYGEAIVLRNIEDGALPSYTGDDAEKYQQEFAEFKRAHKAPEAFEYLIVSPERESLLWDAVPLSASLSPMYIRSTELAKTTRWFTANNPDGWQLQASMLEIVRMNEVPGAVALAES